MLVFARKVISAYKRGDFESLFVIGPQGMGKTTYAMLVLHDVYQDWDKVLHYVVFDPREMLPEFKNALKSGRRIPLIVFDDAGIHLSKYLWTQDRESLKLVLLINSLFNVIRTVCSGVIFTSPDMDVLKELRKKSWWVGQPEAPHGKEDPTRIMWIYRKTILPSGMVRVSKRALEQYKLTLIPKDVRKQYEEKRRQAMEPVLERLEKLWGTPTQGKKSQEP